MSTGPASTRKSLLRHPLSQLVLAACLAFSMVFFVTRILIPYQVSDATLHRRPRGNLSDLYPRWLGARELWLHGRNPYSQEVTLEIQSGYYGRPLDPSNPADPGDQQGFAYPVYVTFLLIPTLRLPFETVRIGFTWLLVALTAASVFCWLRMLRWTPGWAATAAVLLLTLGSFAGLQGVKLQQLSLVVAALLSASAALLVGGHLFAAGVILAIATIKPQLVALLAAFLTYWSVIEWETRRNFLFGFAMTLALLCLGAHWLLPGWIGYFWHALHEYQRYTGGQSRLDVLLGPVVGKGASALLVIGLAAVSYRLAKAPSNPRTLSLAFSTMLAATLVVMPNFAPYNEVLLLPAVLVVAREALDPAQSRGFRLAAAAAGFFLAWGWIAALGLTLASCFAPAATVQRAWAAPLWTEFAIAPSMLLTLGLLLVRQIKTPLGEEPRPIDYR